MHSDITNATSKWGTAINDTLNSAAQGVTVTILYTKDGQSRSIIRLIRCLATKKLLDLLPIARERNWT